MKNIVNAIKEYVAENFINGILPMVMVLVLIIGAVICSNLVVGVDCNGDYIVCTIDEYHESLDVVEDRSPKVDDNFKEAVYAKYNSELVMLDGNG